MNNEVLYRQIENAVTASVHLEEILLIIREFKRGGGTKPEAVQILSRLLDETKNEGGEDLIRDCLDFVTGWCKSGHEIWPDQT